VEKTSTQKKQADLLWLCFSSSPRPSKESMTEPSVIHRSRLPRRFIVVLAVAVVLLLTAGVVTLQMLRASALDQFNAAQESFADKQLAVSAVVDDAESALESAQTTLADSEGKVMVEDSRVALAAAIETVENRVEQTGVDLADVESEAKASTSNGDEFFALGAGYREGAATLSSYSADAADGIRTVADELAGPVQAVVDAVAVWQAEQDRIIASRYNNHVHAVGWIPELDECKGSVDLSAQYGTAAIAEHWSCGGKNFPDEPGQIITLTGERTGTYRVEGIIKMLNQHVATTADIPHGYDLLYQTCQNGQSTTMSLTALTRID
jgi:hypothetical protein